MEFSKLFVFANFGKVRFSKFRNFSEITGIFELTKFSRKSLEKFGNLSSTKKVRILTEIVYHLENFPIKLRKIWNLTKNPVFESNNPVFGSKSLEKVWKKFGKFWKSLESLETGFSKCSEFTEISEIVLFQTFQKLQKMILNSNFENHKKLVPTRKPTRKFG